MASNLVGVWCCFRFEISLRACASRWDSKWGRGGTEQRIEVDYAALEVEKMCLGESVSKKQHPIGERTEQPLEVPACGSRFRLRIYQS